jgi:hypothetical protein
MPATAEPFSWSEGQVWLWTGSATASAQVAFAQNINGGPTWGWERRPSLSGVYRGHLTGLEFPITVGALYTPHTTIQRMAQSATAVHLKLLHSHNGGSAGYVIHSGNILAMPILGYDNGLYEYSLNYVGNSWSAF